MVLLSRLGLAVTLAEEAAARGLEGPAEVFKAGVTLGRVLVHGAEDLAGADFTGAKASEDPHLHTLWPPGFAPVAAGVIFED